MATLALLCLLALAVCANGCIQEYGSIHEGQEKAGAVFTYGYNGLDWGNSFDACKGSRQSPLLLPATGAGGAALPAVGALKSSFSYGILDNPTITNNGHTLQVSLPDTFKSDVRIPFRGKKTTAKGTSMLTSKDPVAGYVQATPAQFHFHTHSEHILSGVQYPLELHIVHFIKKDQLPACGDAGCPTVLGIMIALTDDESQVNPQLRKIIEAMPLYEKQTNKVAGTVDVNALLPKNRTYLTYEGSLTTPPCTEGILWHVMLEPIKVSPTLLTRYMEAVGDNDCPDTKNGKVASEKAEVAAFPGAPPVNPATKCQKLANGHNWRATQPRNNRPILAAVF